MKDNIEIKNKEDLIKQISKEKYGDEYFIEKAILSYKAQQEKTYTFFRDDSKEDLLRKYNWCQRPHEDNMSLHRFVSNGEIEGYMSESLAKNFGLIQIDLNEFIFRFVQPIIKENISLILELETYKKIAELMADFINMYTLSGEEHHYCHKTMSCEVVGGSRSCIDCIIDWARKEVEGNEEK